MLASRSSVAIKLKSWYSQRSNMRRSCFCDGTPLRTKGYQVESIKHLILGLTKKEYRNMNINIYTAFFWEVHEKIEMNVRKWPFKYPEEAQICFDLFLQYLSSVVFQYCL